MHSYTTLSVGKKQYGYYKLEKLEELGLTKLSELPYSIRVLLESVLRNCDGEAVTEHDVRSLAAWKPKNDTEINVPLKPARVILQDFTGVPAVVDLAAMRSAIKKLGGDPKKVNPLIPVDLIIDHSIQTDYFGTTDSLEKNVELEFSRNAERYALLNWAQNSLDNFRVIPPSVGIIHQVNLEFLAQVVVESVCGTASKAGSDKADTTHSDVTLYPDSVLGTDSHTVMINGLGVLGWGVGGIEAEAVMLGLPYYMLAPEVIGFELTGKLKPGVTATDLVLTITEMLRKEGVVGKFVEYFGSGASSMSVYDRAVIANMAPEYGATMGFFPVDAKTIEFLRETGRDEHHVKVVEAYSKAQGLYREADAPTPKYTKTISLDLASVVPSIAGPKRPQDRIPLESPKCECEKDVKCECSDSAAKAVNEKPIDNSVVIASITSCTNTSNPRLMLTAGLLAKKAVEKGLATKPFVKTSLAPGSRVVTAYLEKSGLLTPLEKLGFNVVGYGCLTCIGNSGPLPESAAKEITEKNLSVSAVLSGNRNFEGRVNPLVKLNYLASPPLVVAFALAGTTSINMFADPLGADASGNPVFLKDLWPSEDEIDAAVKSALDLTLYTQLYNSVYSASDKWNEIAAEKSELFDWDRTSTYIQEPPFVTVDAAATGKTAEKSTGKIENAKVLAYLGDSVTTDHISPAGSIKPDSPAGKFLQEHGVAVADFNSYGARRGNDLVMTRGTFANIRIRNKLTPVIEGGVTKFFETGDVMPIYDAAMKYKENGTPLIILAGKEYGTGSSRDWAAKGTALLGVKAVIAESYERIHRGNLVGMGVLPLEFINGQNAESLGLDGTEKYAIEAVTPEFKIGSELEVRANDKRFKVRVRIDTPVELTYYLAGGIMPSVLKKLL
ncbi:MAG: aconitate hydratase AcnA [Thermoguttaceae bacterium]